MSSKFKVNPVLQQHNKADLQNNIENVKASEIFFIFGDRAYLKGCRATNSDSIVLINLAKQLSKPFILCLDNSLPLSDQLYLRDLCPKDKTQVFSFDPTKYYGVGLHNKIMTILNGAINGEVITDPFK